MKLISAFLAILLLLFAAVSAPATRARSCPPDTGPAVPGCPHLYGRVG